MRAARAGPDSSAGGNAVQDFESASSNASVTISFFLKAEFRFQKTGVAVRKSNPDRSPARYRDEEKVEAVAKGRKPDFLVKILIFFDDVPARSGRKKCGGPEYEHGRHSTGSSFVLRISTPPWRCSSRREITAPFSRFAFRGGIRTSGQPGAIRILLSDSC